MSNCDQFEDVTTVLVVDDSLFMRRLISDAIDRVPGFRVIGTATDGEAALRCIAELDPDVVTLDIEMPRLDGFGVLEAVMGRDPRAIVVVSAHTQRGSAAAVRALALGAVDVVSKPSGPVSLDLREVTGELQRALEAAREVRVDALTPRATRTVPLVKRTGHPDAIVAIAASTGGPRALSFVLGALPAKLGAAVLVVQHMPPGFTAALAKRLDTLSPLPVAEAIDGAPIVPDRIWLAPGDFHMRVRRIGTELRIALDQGQPIWGSRPAADALFASIAKLCGETSIGVVLTGMGRDGAVGLAAIRTAGGLALAQDRATSIVYGMPARAVEEGAVDAVLPLEQIPSRIVEWLNSLAAVEAGGWR
ncbi:MAG: chemotaxis response regulator protein-glutamate methylesterase [Gemmatimonadales bacterium]|jgi:two-component system chemotaxis response regulator CheB